VDLTLHFVLCALIGVAVLALAAYRKSLAVDEEHPLHLANSNPAVTDSTTNHRLALIDRTRRILTIVLIVYGAGLICWTLYVEMNRAL
jgi:hypothetical protein